MSAQKTTNLKELSKLTGISYKSVKLAFDRTDAPSLYRPVAELIVFLKMAVPGAVKLPADLDARQQLLKYETAVERKGKVVEERERLRLLNLEKHGKLVARDEVQAQGAAVGVALSSLINEFELSGPGMCSGKQELELHAVFQEECDKLRAAVRGALERLSGLKAAEELK